MKIRSGFVSNSSSSSFIMLMTDEQYQNMLKTVDRYQKAVLKKLGFVKRKVFSKNLVVISGLDGDHYSSFDNIDINIAAYQDLDDDEFVNRFGYRKSPAEAFENIKWPKDIFIHYVEL